MISLNSILIILSTVSFLNCAEKWRFQRDTMIVNLNIANRDWDPKRPDKSVGWCAETCIQMALSYYGVEISQKSINKAGSPSHPDLYMDEIDVALNELSIKYLPWKSKDKELDDFIMWIKKMLDSHYPVLCGVKIYPDEKPGWFLDHFVLIVGYSKKGFLVNTNMKGQKLISFKQLSSLHHGFSFRNRKNRYFARAITGLKKPVPTFKIN
jgi:ABC-type bacteriocin/lantibiotic exporter with double-glycine peptidase domain